jgi:hypothetical protein
MAAAIAAFCAALAAFSLSRLADMGGSQGASKGANKGVDAPSSIGAKVAAVTN